jgi:hypothetical protein
VARGCPAWWDRDATCGIAATLAVAIAVIDGIAVTVVRDRHGRCRIPTTAASAYTTVRGRAPMLPTTWPRVALAATAARPDASERVAETWHPGPRNVINLQRTWVTLFAEGP